jgi:hypothetical protein
MHIACNINGTSLLLATAEGKLSLRCLELKQFFTGHLVKFLSPF